MFGQNAYRPYIFLDDLIRQTKFISQTLRSHFLFRKGCRKHLILCLTSYGFPGFHIIQWLDEMNQESSHQLPSSEVLITNPQEPVPPPCWVLIMTSLLLLFMETMNHMRSFIHQLSTQGTHVAEFSSFQQFISKETSFVRQWHQSFLFLSCSYWILHMPFHLPNVPPISRVFFEL